MPIVRSAGVLLMLTAAPVAAHEYPNRPIRIVTSPSGGGGDFASRQIAQGISPPLGQPVIIENRTAGVLGETVARAASDGYTLLIMGSTLWVAPLIRKTLYDAIKDFAPIVTINKEPSVLMVHPSLPVKSVKELIALAKTRPGELNFSSGTGGSPAQLAGELLKSMAGINIVHVPYQSGVQGLTGLLAGDVQLAFIGVPSAMPHVKSGRLRALAVTSAQPSLLVPGVAPLNATVPGYELVSTNSMFAPAGTAAAIVLRLSQEVVRFLNNREIKEKFLSAGSEIVGNSPEELSAMIRVETMKLGKVIKSAGIAAH